MRTLRARVERLEALVLGNDALRPIEVDRRKQPESVKRVTRPRKEKPQAILEPALFLTMEECMARFKRASANALRKDIARGIVPKPRKVGGRNLFVETEVVAAEQRIVSDKKEPK